MNADIGGEHQSMLKTMRALALLACLTVGCATGRTSQVRVVDAGTGQPLSGVRVDRLGFMLQPAMPGIIPVCIPFPLETAISDSSGLVRFRKPGKDFALEKDTYERIRITETLRGFNVKGSRDLPCLLLPQNDCVQVPLRKAQSH
jgi:hypothetical protein